MMTNRLSRAHPIGYLIVVDPEPCGPVIGTLNGRPIAAAVRDAFGRRFSYVGAAPRLPNGAFDATALAEREWFVQPGLVYRLECSDRPGFLARLRRRDRTAPPTPTDRDRGRHPRS